MRSLRRCSLGLCWLVLAAPFLAAEAGKPSEKEDYVAHEGDIVFQALPRIPAVAVLEQVTESPYVHCGVLVRDEAGWQVVEAWAWSGGNLFQIKGVVQATPWLQWRARAREDDVRIYRLQEAYSEHLQLWLKGVRARLGRPYDLRFAFGNEAYYCSELLYEPFLEVYEEELGAKQRLEELNLGPYREAWKASPEGEALLKRELITPKALMEAEQLERVY